MQQGDYQQDVETVTFLVDYLSWDYIEATQQQVFWHNFEWTRKGALLTLRHSQVAAWVQIFSEISNWAIRDNMQAAVKRIPASATKSLERLLAVYADAVLDKSENI